VDHYIGQKRMPYTNRSNSGGSLRLAGSAAVIVLVCDISSAGALVAEEADILNVSSCVRETDYEPQKDLTSDFSPVTRPGS
jgi:hypothetical protein